MKIMENEMYFAYFMEIDMDRSLKIKQSGLIDFFLEKGNCIINCGREICVCNSCLE